MRIWSNLIWGDSYYNSLIIIENNRMDGIIEMIRIENKGKHWDYN